jgi:hypothetical protein
MPCEGFVKVIFPIRRRFIRGSKVQGIKVVLNRRCTVYCVRLLRGMAFIEYTTLNP